MKANVLFLVHGVGEARANEMTSAVLKARGLTELPNTDIVEVLWNEAVPQVWDPSRRIAGQAFYDLVVSVGQSLTLVRQLHSDPLSDAGRKITHHLFQLCDVLMHLAWMLFFGAGIVLGAFALSRWSESWEVLEYLRPLGDFQIWIEMGLFWAGVLIAASIVFESALMFVMLLKGSQQAVTSALGGALAIVALRLFMLGYRVMGWLFLLCEIAIFHPLRRAWRTPWGKWVLLTGPSFALGCWVTFRIVKGSEHWMAEFFSPLLLSVFALCAVRVAAYITKAVGDIFHYVADPDRRAKIQDYVHSRLEGAIKCDGEVYISGHSLGSVIAMDYLWNRAVFGNKRVTLLTGGSPLARFFYRYLPRLFFPPDAAACALGLEKKFHSFRWFNFYRWFDYVGQRLGLPQMIGYGEQRLFNPFAFHRNYWGDPRVHRMVDCMSAAQDPFTRIYASSYDGDPVKPWPRRIKWGRMLRRSTLHSFLLSVLIVLFLNYGPEEFRATGIIPLAQWFVFGVVVLIMFWVLFLLVWMLALLVFIIIPHSKRPIKVTQLHTPCQPMSDGAVIGERRAS